MNAFEALVAFLFERDGYWVKPSYKVALTKEEKRRIGRPSCPRWEIDIVAYKVAKNEVLVVECKSYLDSRGIKADGLMGKIESLQSRFKLFNEKILRKTVLSRLTIQLVESGLCAEEPRVRLCLVAGKIATYDDRVRLEKHFSKMGWLLFDDSWLNRKLSELSSSAYEDEVAAIVAKLLLRE